MKKSKFQLTLLIVTLTCLVILVGIQINWILKAAKMQEACVRAMQAHVT